MFLCPKCFEQSEKADVSNLVRAAITCDHCHHSWLERSSELKHHKNERLGRLEEIEDVLLQLRYEKLDQKFNEKEMTAQRYANSLKQLEAKHKSAHGIINAVWTNRST
jgi:Zn-finger nucleic acid-binding protein